MKTLYISFILLHGGLIEVEIFDTTCANFWKQNVITVENKNIYRRNAPLTTHKYKTWDVVGYVCSDKRPT